MKNLKIYLVTTFCAVLLCACAKKAERVVTSSNSAVQVEKLFELDGCTVYRFIDEGRNHYFTNCQGSLSQRLKCGKKCSYAEEIQTHRETSGNE